MIVNDLEQTLHMYILERKYILVFKTFHLLISMLYVRGAKWGSSDSPPTPKH